MSDEIRKGGEKKWGRGKEGKWKRGKRKRGKMEKGKKMGNGKGVGRKEGRSEPVRSTGLIILF